MATTADARQTAGPPDSAGLPNADIVMKGGITSGVVYPGAVWELAQAFRFRSIGGASAGAIAAAATAAAEYGRQSGRGRGYAGVQALPRWLADGDGGRLFGFFKPDPRTAQLFAVAVSFVGSGGGRGHRVAKAVLLAFPVPLLIGLLPALALAVAALTGGWTPLWALALVAAAVVIPVALTLILPTSSAHVPKADEKVQQHAARLPWRQIVFALVALPVILAAVALADRHGTAGHFAMNAILLVLMAYVAFAVPIGAAAGTMLVRALRVLPDNFFGLCTGIDPDGSKADAEHPALTPWLTGYLDELAGPHQDETGRPRPLVFGDLAEHDIDLQVMTTNLTAVRGFRLPFDGSDDWYFEPAEFEKLFPSEVVRWMIRPGAKRIGTKVALPAGAEFPVVVAVRMSLSLPVLLSAIPLYVDRGRATNGGALEKCWFSDGGLVSNFPIHLFDSPLPRWPTFAINLRGFPKGKDPDHAHPCTNVHLAESEAGDPHEDWSEIGSLPAFLGSLKSVMENAHDNEQMRQVGFRDRIAHVRLSHDEGGLNLKMPPDRVTELSARGACAGAALRTRFTAPADAELSWANHRWVRYRITMANIQEFLEKFDRGYHNCAPEGPHDGVCPEYEPSYAEMIARNHGDPPPHLFWGPKEQEAGQRATAALIALHKEFRKKDGDLDDGRLHPHTELRNVPHA